MSFVIDYIEHVLKTSEIAKRVCVQGEVMPEDADEMRVGHVAMAKNVLSFVDKDMPRGRVTAFDAKALVDHPIMRSALCYMYAQLKTFEDKGIGAESLPFSFSYTAMVFEAQKISASIVELGSSQRFMEALENYKPHLAKKMKIYNAEARTRDIQHIPPSRNDLENEEIVADISRKIRHHLTVNHAEQWKYKI